MSISPMMKQYLDIKSNYKDCILLWRLGDFYEMFFDDAINMSSELNLTLTGRDCGLEKKAPMCGIPYHSINMYIYRMVNNNHKVAICEQLEDPALSKGIVKRDVVKVVTKGTIIDIDNLNDDSNNYIVGICIYNNEIGMSICDVSTGIFKAQKLDSINQLINEIYSYKPSEIILDNNTSINIDIEKISYKIDSIYSVISDNNYDNYKKNTLDHFKNQYNLNDIDKILLYCSGLLLDYLYKTQKNNISQITSLDLINRNEYLEIDYTSKNNLEIVTNSTTNEKKHSLLWVIDKCMCACGSRYLKNIIERPLTNISNINNRLDFVEELYDDIITLDKLRNTLSRIRDFERIMTRIVTNNATVKDLIVFKESLFVLPYIKDIVLKLKSNIAKDIIRDFDLLEDLYKLIDESINDDFEINESYIIKKGYDEEIDRLRTIKDKSKELISQIEQKESEKTSIPKLRIKYNKVFGYFIEVTNSYIKKVPEYYERKQTLTNCERYVIPELKELENSILNAKDKLDNREKELFNSIKKEISKSINRVTKMSKIIAKIDTFSTFAYVANKNNYIRPTFNEKNIINIVEARHPVIEKIIKNENFIPNDIYIDGNKKNISIITGPNMAGKSTYMRQCAIISLLSQVGSFVPCKKADMTIVDKIFIRVGASDDLSTGRSTFMMEMTELSNIIKNATINSLVVLDEIGRGTSTSDGLSIAQATIEYINENIKCKTLFATHYHELIYFNENNNNINFLTTDIADNDGNIIFLRKIIKGKCDKSYGIHVATLAGLPKSITNKATNILNKIENNNFLKKTSDKDEHKQIPIDFKINNYNDKYLDIICNIDINNSKPTEIVRLVEDMQEKIRRERNNADN